MTSSCSLSMASTPLALKSHKRPSVQQRRMPRPTCRPSAYDFAPTRDSRNRFATAGPGTVNFVLGDFFQRGWEASCFAGRDDRGFDLIYDYTVSRSSTSVGKSL